MVNLGRSHPTHHYVDDKDSDIAKRTASSAKVRERLVARRVNDEKAWDLVLHFELLFVASLK